MKRTGKDAPRAPQAPEIPAARGAEALAGDILTPHPPAPRREF